jgi:deoxyribodipyrimidine photo-lyase
LAPPALLWFRQDLRLADNPALGRAVDAGGPLVCLYVLDEQVGGAQRWWLHHSLGRLGEELAKRGNRLVLRRGNAAEIVEGLAAEVGASSVLWNRCYEPAAVERDSKLKEGLKQRGIAVASENASLLMEPWALRTGSRTPFKVYTPFWRALSAAYSDEQPAAAPKRLPPAPDLSSDNLDRWGLLPPGRNWAAGFDRQWTPGEAGAQKRLAVFLEEGLGDYRRGRARPDFAGTSRLSPHLHWGEISPRQLWHAVRHWADAKGDDAAAEKFLSELGWREFSHHLLFHYPRLPNDNWRAAFDRFPWRRDPRAVRAWQQGRTGYPIVDAGMRELWQTGWMHNRVRMVAASFLVKHLLLDWREGAAWFWDTLVDADLANNAASWQWVAGSGADAAPYFRIFNPVLQGQRFDPAGAYVRRWLPELAALPDRWIHEPWNAASAVMLQAGIDLGRSYPRPIVDHRAARERALAAFAAMKESA